MERKEFLQRQAASLLAKETRLLCRWATGAGKTNVALNFIRDHPGIRCLVLVPEQNNITNWLFEFDKFKVSHDNVTIACYASFRKFADSQWDLIVFDEVPHIDTELRRAVCNSMSGVYVLALGAVVDKDELASLEEAYGPFYISDITLKDAILYGLVPKPRVCILHLEMDNKKKVFFYNHEKCTALEKYLFINKRLDDAKKSYEDNPTQGYKIRMQRLGNERKRFLGSLKEDAVRKLCTRLQSKGKRFLCFCASIKQANNLGGANAFTSKTPKAMTVLNNFNDYKLSSLFAVSKLIEGQNLVGIESGIITQLGNTPRITVQMIGRILRSKNPIIYIPVFDNTKDDKFLLTVTDNVPEDCIQHYKFSSVS